MRLRRNRSKASVRKPRCSTTSRSSDQEKTGAVWLVLLIDSDPRIERSVQEVDAQIGGDHDHRLGDGRAEDDVVIVAPGSAHHHPPKPPASKRASERD